MDFLKAEPEVGVNWSKPSFVVSPRQLPVESVAEMLVNDDPTKYRPDVYRIWLGRYCYVNSDVCRNETCKSIIYDTASTEMAIRNGTIDPSLLSDVDDLFKYTDDTAVLVDENTNADADAEFN